METKVKDLAIEELRSLVSDTVREDMNNSIEDMLALSSDDYLKSIEEAGNDYKTGRVRFIKAQKSL